MPDRLHALLNAEADRLVGPEVVPPRWSVRVRRVRPAPAGRLRTVGPVLAAAAAVVAVALVAGQLRGGAAVTAPTVAATAAAEREPELGTLSVSPALRKRLGVQEDAAVSAPADVRSDNVPLPSQVDLLAEQEVTPGTAVRLIGYSSGRTSCERGYLDRPGNTGGGSSCYSGQIDPRAGARFGLGQSYLGTGPGQRLVTARLPAGTAELRLSSDGRTVTVPAFDGGTRWNGLSFAIAPWPYGPQAPRGEALAADGSVLATTFSGPDLATLQRPLDAVAACVRKQGVKVDVLPGGAYRYPPGTDEQQRACREQGLAASYAGEPELGTVPTPDIARLSTSPGPEPAAPSQVDVLAREEVEPGITAYQVGFVKDSTWCTFSYLVNAARPGAFEGGTSSCGPRSARKAGFDRSWSGGNGRPSEQLLFARLPPGTVRLRLSAAGVPTKTVQAYDAGQRWDQWAFAVTSWPSDVETQGDALAADGSVLMRISG